MNSKDKHFFKNCKEDEEIQTAYSKYPEMLPIHKKHELCITNYQTATLTEKSMS